MSRNRRNRQAQHAAVTARPVADQRAAVQDGVMLSLDSYSNPLARLGVGAQNHVEASQYPITRRTQDYALMNSLYRNDWIAGRVVDTVPEDMCKNWYKLNSQVTPDQIKDFERAERRTDVKRAILEGLKWGRLYGGAAGVIVIDGQEDMLNEPLDLEMIMPGQFKGVLVADRWSGVYPSGDLVEDISDPDFGLPAYYTFTMERGSIGSGIRVHHSRVLRFIGRELPYVERMAEQQWGMSELEHVFEELNKRNMTSANIAQLIFQANLRILKMSNYGQALATTSPTAQRQLHSLIEAQNALMNNQSVQIMDKDDSFESHQYSFSGLSDVYELFMLDIAGAAEIPVTKLFGRSPAGMNSTGESDLINYYDMIAQKQESILRPVLDKLVPVLCMSTWGVMPDDLEFEFEPIRNSSDKERADLVKQTSDAINALFTSNLITQRIALKELRHTESFTGMWGAITDEDIEHADGEGELPPLIGVPATPPRPPEEGMIDA